MKIKNIFILFLVTFSICVSIPAVAQTGGRKKEHRNQRSRGKLFNRPKSGGHADAFARGNKKGFFARIFKGKSSGSSWTYKRTNPGAKQNREQAQLFKRSRTKNKSYRDGILASQNKRRAGSRSNSHSFSKKRR